MAKLGLGRHRYTIAILCWLYVILSLLMHIYCIFNTFVGSIFVISCIYLLIGVYGLYSLYKENGTLMKIFGIILIIISVLQILELIGVLMISLLRDTFLDLFLKEAMDTYYDSAENRDLMDGIQRELKCCGRQSYNDWTIYMQPSSCCRTSECLDYHIDGCVSALSPYFTSLILVSGFVGVISIIVHIYGVVSAFNLARVYNRRPILPTIKHGFANY
ncbi:CD63 antigen-like [Bradysia coprophila]|uniref:CD63 antigen-like n=1 Tax=Bradysia coprophila TaxID=38358 RepID=UPI00187DD676|nr:CD63 antigen-like [Bradysia coprophila]